MFRVSLKEDDSKKGKPDEVIIELRGNYQNMFDLICLALCGAGAHANDLQDIIQTSHRMFERLLAGSFDGKAKEFERDSADAFAVMTDIGKLFRKTRVWKEYESNSSVENDLAAIANQIKKVLGNTEVVMLTDESGVEILQGLDAKNGNKLSKEDALKVWHGMDSKERVEAALKWKGMV